MLSVFRGIRVAIHTLVGLILAVLVGLDPTRRLDAQRLSRWWSQHLLSMLGIRLQVHGAPVAGGVLTVANHVSWLDIFALAASQPTRFVAKSEIRDWPVAGWLANAIGTFYIRRGKGGARPLLEKLTPWLAGGGRVVVFPEGTTTDGIDVLPFHPRLFGAALSAGCTVQPAALRYSADARGRHLAPFVGDDNLVSHLMGLLGAKHLQIDLHYLAPIAARSDATRDELASQAHHAVRQSLTAVGQSARRRRSASAEGVWTTAAGHLESR